MKEAIAAGKNVMPYRPDFWTNGGYPLAGTMPCEPPDMPATVTLLARKR